MQNHNKPQGTPRIGSSAVLGDTFAITLDKKEWDKCMAEIKSASELPKLVLDIIQRLAKPGSFRLRSTTGASVVIALQPSDALAQLCAAIRTLKLNLLVIKHGAHKSKVRAVSPNDPKLSHGHWRLAHDCNLDFQISCLNPNLNG